MVCIQKSPARVGMDGNDDKRVIHWSEPIEKVVAEVGEQALCYSWLHATSERKCSRYNNYLVIPVIFLSTLSGTASVATDLFAGWGYAPVIIGLVSISVGVLQTLNSYFSYGKRAEAHRISHQHYTKLHSFIVVELALPRDERMDAKSLLKVVREQAERLQEVSPALPHSSIDEFKAKFKDVKDVSKPTVANGIDRVEVYVENPLGALNPRGARGQLTPPRQL